jgi:hypothetical protein
MEYGQWEAALQQYRVYLAIETNTALETFVDDMERLIG